VGCEGGGSPPCEAGGDEGGLGAAGALSPGVTSSEVARELREIAEEVGGGAPSPPLRSTLRGGLVYVCIHVHFH